jgi:hypothetical protein
MFAGRPMRQQYQMLRDALWLLLSYDKRDESEEPTVLSAIARTHARFDPVLFDRFRQAVLHAVAKHDPAGARAAAVWGEAMAPGLQYLKNRAAESAGVLREAPPSSANVHPAKAAARRGAPVAARVVGPGQGLRRTRAHDRPRHGPRSS